MNELEKAAEEYAEIELERHKEVMAHIFHPKEAQRVRETIIDAVKFGAHYQQQQAAQLQAEVDRLREALEKIIRMAAASDFITVGFVSKSGFFKLF